MHSKDGQTLADLCLTLTGGLDLLADFYSLNSNNLKNIQHPPVAGTRWSSPGVTNKKTVQFLASLPMEIATGYPMAATGGGFSIGFQQTSYY